MDGTDAIVRQAINRRKVHESFTIITRDAAVSAQPHPAALIAVKRIHAVVRQAVLLRESGEISPVVTRHAATPGPKPDDAVGTAKDLSHTVVGEPFGLGEVDADLPVKACDAGAVCAKPDCAVGRPMDGVNEFIRHTVGSG